MAKILIIGGGVSGLSAGIYAQLSGHHAVICEKHGVAGGNLTGWQRGEYHIDNCIHWLTGTNKHTSAYKMWETLGALGDVEIYQGDTLYTAEHGGIRLSLHKDLQKLRQEMLLCSPRDKKETESFITAVSVMQKLCGIGGKTHSERLSPWGAVRKAPLLWKYYTMSTGELASSFSHPAIRFFLRSFLGEDFGALALLTVFATFCGENGGIPRGGSSEMAQRMTNRFLSLGGQLKTQSEVKAIATEGGKAVNATLSDGVSLEADYFVLTADPSAIFGKILDAPLPRGLQKQRDNPRMKCFSAYHAAFSCDLSGDQLPFRGDLIFPAPPKHRHALGWDQIVLREFSHEPSFAPPGKSLLQTVTFCDESRARQFIDLRENDRQGYKEEKRALADLQLRILEDRFPIFKGKLACIDTWTPATYRRYTNSESGAFMSRILPSWCFPARLSNRVRGFDNILLATQWQQCPGGLPIAAEGGRLAIETINKMEAVAVKNKSPRRSPAYGRV